MINRIVCHVCFQVVLLDVAFKACKLTPELLREITGHSTVLVMV